VTGCGFDDDDNAFFCDGVVGSEVDWLEWLG